MQFTFEALDACNTCDYAMRMDLDDFGLNGICVMRCVFFVPILLFIFIFKLIWIMETVRNSQYLLSILLLRIQSQK